MKVDWPLHRINSVINEFQGGTDHGDERFVIPRDLYGINKPFISIEIPFCKLNEIKSKHFFEGILQII